MIKKRKYLSVEDVPVWQQAHNLVLLVYRFTLKFPNKEIYGLSSQLKRASSSIAANISEGFYRKSTKELLQFLYNARGSNGEVLYHIRLAKDLGYLKEKDYFLLKEVCDKIGKQLNGWIKSLRGKLQETKK